MERDRSSRAPTDPSQTPALDDPFSLVAAMEPAFAGLYIQENRLVVRLTALDRLDSAMNAVRQVYGRDHIAPYEPATGLIAAHDWRPLTAWKATLDGIFRFATVHQLDVDEFANGIRIAIADRSEEAAICSHVADVGVPLDAVSIEVRARDARI
jgi:hypothetical protein